MPSFPITSQAVHLSQSITQSALIQNNGPDTLYLAQDSSVTTGAYSMRVTPGASVTWPANTELWGISDGTANVGILYNAAGASVSEVTVGGNVASDFNLDLLSPDPLTSVYSNLGAYQSLLIVVLPANGTPSGESQFSVEWYITPTQTLAYRPDTASFYSTGGGLSGQESHWILPVKSGSMLLSQASGPTPNRLYVFGSRTSLPQEYYSQSYLNPVMNQQLVIPGISIGAGGTAVQLLSTRAGNASLTITTSSMPTTGVLDVLVEDVNGAALWYSWALGNPSSLLVPTLTEPLILPRRPARLRLINQTSVTLAVVPAFNFLN